MYLLCREKIRHWLHPCVGYFQSQVQFGFDRFTFEGWQIFHKLNLSGFKYSKSLLFCKDYVALKHPSKSRLLEKHADLGKSSTVNHCA